MLFYLEYTYNIANINSYLFNLFILELKCKCKLPITYTFVALSTVALSFKFKNNALLTRLEIYLIHKLSQKYYLFKFFFKWSKNR